MHCCRVRKCQWACDHVESTSCFMLHSTVWPLVGARVTVRASDMPDKGSPSAFSHYYHKRQWIEPLCGCRRCGTQPESYGSVKRNRFRHSSRQGHSLNSTRMKFYILFHPRPVSVTQPNFDGCLPNITASQICSHFKWLHKSRLVPKHLWEITISPFTLSLYIFIN